jgi:2-succinyl-6-hydroxy-2,4-cyclohexadiene-1-carboxylate synthase
VLIAVNGIEVSVADHGSADDHPLVLVHGFTGRASDWDGVVDDLTQHRRVLTVEHRGHGHSTNTGDASTYTFDQLVLDLAAVVDALGLERFDLLGHSMGGVVAMRYALAHPERLTSLVLMDTGAGASHDEVAATFMRAGIERARAEGLLAVHEQLARFLPEETRATVRQNFELMDPVAFCALGEELLTHPSILDQLAGLALPTTVLVGEHDAGLRSAADDLAAAIPGARLVVVPDAGHSPQVENRAAWLEAMRSHLT